MAEASPLHPVFEGAHLVQIALYAALLDRAHRGKRLKAM